ncbi:YicC/YloC family endoribonuclease [Palleronia aestuarii]|nr:YicC/YloC family endoribonuclease [Palleronia aestuarii]
MTGYAAAGRSEGPWSWSWEVRGVNGRDLSVRVRTPDWVEGLEREIIASVERVASRGSINVGLRLKRENEAGHEAADIDRLTEILDRVRAVEELATTRGIVTAPCRATDIIALAQRSGEAEAMPPRLRDALLVHLRDTVLPDFVAMRAAEGRLLGRVLTDHLDEIERLLDGAAERVAARRDVAAETLRGQVTRMLDLVEVDADRLAQEVAILATRSDVTEELNRLAAHVAAARALLEGKAPAGRKLVFLLQEFNREANTLCAKSQDTELTRSGLDLKAAIEQMREQVQNVE